MEKWIKIKGFNGLYQISNHGRVKSFHRNKDGIILSQCTQKLRHTNYMAVTLVRNATKYSRRVHRLVAEAFIDNEDKKPHVNHIDNNGENNHYANLEWCTSAENTAHSTKQERNKHNNVNANLWQSEKALQNRKHMIGKMYGKWLVVGIVSKDYTTKTISKMLCKCECGTKKEVDMISLKNGRSTQCKSCSAKETLRRRYASSI